ncbi:YqcI/YcgG family protein [Streptomyces sp. NPDC056704]|uniref:YqcI/YcgG family protein n=1 Tax=Streptomyces sp. NPDC056704 TaxID=3345917 RepID=UPI00368F5ED7
MTARPRLIRSSESSEATGGERPDWFPEARAAFVRRLADPSGYPCHFGVRGEQAGNNWFTAYDDLAGLAEDLRAFAKVAETGPTRQSLVVFVGPPDTSLGLAEDAVRFWRLLDDLRQHDASRWPAGLPQNPGAADWQWCFAGRPWFVFGCSPSYEKRRSRNVGPCLTLVFQLVERVFQGLSGSTVAGKAAKRQIRARLREYDAVGPHPHLGDPLHSSTHKWRQYFLPDDDALADATACPLTGARWTDTEGYA